MAKGMPFRQKLLIAVIVILIFIAFAAWNNFDDSINWWILWTVPIIFLASWLLVDCMFLDDRDFIFDHDYENWRRRTDPMY